MCWLHGFTQSGASAHRFRSILAGVGEVIAPDLPRHGRHESVGGALDDIARFLLDDLPEEPFTLGGYSFGARVALHMALMAPERLSGLVVLGATRGIRDPQARAKRVERDDALAARISSIGAERFIEEWLAQPMFRTLRHDPLELAARSLTNTVGLAASLREAGTGQQRWLGDELEGLRVPTLALAGSCDDRFAREALAIAQLTAGTVSLIPGASHAAHLERPEWTARVIINAWRHF